MKLREFGITDSEWKALKTRQVVDTAPSAEMNTYVPLSCAELMANPPKPPTWVIEHLFPQGSVSIIGGDGGIGKSMLVLYLCLCVASGQALFGKFPVKQGKVLLIDEEDAITLINKRMIQLMNGMGLKSPVPLLILDNKGIRLDSDESCGKLGNLITKETPTLVTMDSLIRVHSAEENSANEMNDVLRRAKALIANFDSSIVFTHHTRKPSKGSYMTSQMLRGSSDIRNFVDSYLFMTGNVIEKTLIHDKARWASPVPKFTVKLEDFDAEFRIVKPEDVISDKVKVFATRYSYVGDNLVEIKIEHQPKEQAKEQVIYLLKNKGKLLRKQIIEEVQKTAAIGINNIDAALHDLKKDGKVDSEGGGGIAKEFWLLEK